MLALPRFLQSAAYVPAPQPVYQPQPAAYQAYALPMGGDALQVSLAAQLEQIRGMLAELQRRMDQYQAGPAVASIAPLAPPPPPPPPPAPPAPPPPPPPPPAPPAVDAAPAPAPAAVGPKMFNPGPVPLEGYDGTKLNDLSHRTVKYVFGRVASNYPLDSVHDKASAQALLERMKPDLVAAGLTIKGINGDKILVNTPIGDEWVDVIRGAGAPNPGWWWGSEGKAVPGSAPGPEQLPGGPAPAPAPVPGAGGDLSTVPLTDDVKNAPIDKSSTEAAVKSAATWVKNTYPDFFTKGDDRPTALAMMTKVIGALRAHGYDAFRVVNYADRPVGDAGRYGKDALVVDGRVWDVYVGWGDPNASTPSAQNVGPWDLNRARGARE